MVDEEGDSGKTIEEAREEAEMYKRVTKIPPIDYANKVQLGIKQNGDRLEIVFSFPKEMLRKYFEKKSEEY